jgi:hypothetical protein
VPLSQAIVCAKARSIFNDLKGGDSDAKSVTASHGWLSNFKARHGFENVKMSGESASTDFEAAEKFPKELRDIIEEGGYTAKQVFNVDETGLYWEKKCLREHMSPLKKRQRQVSKLPKIGLPSCWVAMQNETSN